MNFVKPALSGIAARRLRSAWSDLSSTFSTVASSMKLLYMPPIGVVGAELSTIARIWSCDRLNTSKPTPADPWSLGISVFAAHVPFT